MLVSLQSSPPLLSLSGRFTGAHLFLQKSLFLHSLLQRQANPLSLGLRDDKTLSKQQKASVRKGPGQKPPAASGMGKTLTLYLS